MSKADLTKAHIVEQAAWLFNQQGYAGTSMSALMQATGLKKGGIYNHFDSKDDLAIAAFDFAVDRIGQAFKGALKGKRHAVARLLAIVQVYGHMAEDPPVKGGCPILNTAIESDDTHPALRVRAQQAMNRWQGLCRRIIERGKRRGELRLTVDTDQVTTTLIATLEGAVMLSKLYGDGIYLQRALDHLHTYVQDLAVSPDNPIPENLAPENADQNVLH